jgi:hypothetical protein
MFAMHGLGLGFGLDAVGWTFCPPEIIKCRASETAKVLNGLIGALRPKPILAKAESWSSMVITGRTARIKSGGPVCPRDISSQIASQFPLPATS